MGNNHSNHDIGYINDKSCVEKTQNTVLTNASQQPSSLGQISAAQRALDEAQARRNAAGTHAPYPEERFGRGGLDPVRFGDWEINGIICDF